MDLSNFLSEIRRQRDDNLLDEKTADVKVGTKRLITSEQLGFIEYQANDSLEKGDVFLVRQSLQDISVLVICKEGYVDGIGDELIYKIIDLCKNANKTIADSALKVIYFIALKQPQYIQNLLDLDIYESIVTNLPCIWACKVIRIFAENNQNAQDLFISQHIHQYLLQLFIKFRKIPGINKQLLLTMTAFTKHLEFDDESINVIFPELKNLLEDGSDRSLKTGLQFLIDCRNTEIINKVIDSDIIPKLMHMLPRYISNNYQKNCILIIKFLQQIATFRSESAQLLIDSDLCGFILSVRNMFTEEDKGELINLSRDAIIYSSEHARSFITQDFIQFIAKCMLDKHKTLRYTAILFICSCFKAFLMDGDIIEEVDTSGFSNYIQDFLLENNNFLVLEIIDTLNLILKTVVRNDDEPPNCFKKILDIIEGEDFRDMLSDLTESNYTDIAEAATDLIESIENYI